MIFGLWFDHSIKNKQKKADFITNKQHLEQHLSFKVLQLQTIGLRTTSLTIAQSKEADTQQLEIFYCNWDYVEK